MPRSAHARLAVIALSALWLTAVGCSNGPTPPPVDPAALPGGVLHVVTADGTADLHVRIAETEATREHGLMGVRRLGPDDGMAFVFPGPTTAAFWMKDTLVPLSIAFWGRGGRILSIQEMPPCRADPCPLYSPGQPFVGAAEAPAGFFSRSGARAGDQVVLERTR